jgi:hypothetical protein
MHSYRPSGVISGGGLLLLLILAILSGLIFGAILWAVDSYLHLYLVIAFPILGGALAGGVLTRAVKSAKIRSPLMAGLMGIVAGIIMYGVYHFASYYVTFRNDVRSIYEENHPNDTFTDAEFDDYLNVVLQREVGDTGFVGYLKFAADTGFSITRTSATSNESGLEIQGNVAFAYWGVEILLAALVAAILPWNAAKEPFDETSNQWYGGPTVIALSSTKSRKALLRALKDGSFEDAGRLLTKQQMKYPRLELWTRRSPSSPAEDVMLLVKVVQRNKRANNVSSGMVSASELDTLAKAIDTTTAPNPVVSKA